MDRSRASGRKFWRFLTEPFWFVVERTGRARDYFSVSRSCLVGLARIYIHVGSWSITIGFPAMLDRELD